MAMRGFEEIAEIVQENGESYLELKLKEMAAHSRVSGEMMAGKLKTLKYEHNEVLEEARIENNIVKIPMEACRIHRWTGDWHDGNCTSYRYLQCRTNAHAGKHCTVIFLGINKK